MADESVEQEEQAEYDGFATPSLVLEGSDNDKIKSGLVIDRYAKTKEQDGLMCGWWTIGLEDNLIHISLTKPVAAICDEREEWAAKMTWLKKPIDYMEGAAQPLSSQRTAKQQPIPDAETGEVKWS